MRRTVNRNDGKTVRIALIFRSADGSLFDSDAVQYVGSMLADSPLLKDRQWLDGKSLIKEEIDIITSDPSTHLKTIWIVLEAMGTAEESVKEFSPLSAFDSYKAAKLVSEEHSSEAFTFPIIETRVGVDFMDMQHPPFVER